MKVLGREIKLFNKSQSNEYSVMKEIHNITKEDNISTTQRPALDFVDSFGGDGVRIKLSRVHKRTIYDIAVYSDVVRTIINTTRNEIFREGIEFKERFAQKCDNKECEHEFKDIQKETKCPECNKGNLIEPDKKQMKVFNEWKDRVNLNNQSLEDVCKMLEDDLNIIDDCYMVFIKDYKFTRSIMTESILREVIRGDPRDFDIIADKTGRPGRNDIGMRLFTCVRHRDKVYGETKEGNPMHTHCPICKTPLYRAYYRSKDSSGNVMFFIEGEVVHASKFYPSLTYGCSNIISAWQKIILLLEQDRYMKDWYVKGRPPNSMVFARTSNFDSLKKVWKDIIENQRRNPHYIPIIPVGDSKGNEFVKLVKFVDTIAEMQYTEVRNEARKQIGALWHVMPLFIGQTEQSGGLNNDSQQITITNRGTQEGQKVWNTKIFPEIEKQFEFTDYEIKVEKPEKMDEMTDKRLLAQDLANAQIMVNLGFEIEKFENNKFTFSEEPVNEPVSQTGGGSFGATPPFGGQEGSGQDNTGEPNKSVSTETSGVSNPVYGKVKRMFDNEKSNIEKELKAPLDINKEKSAKLIDFVIKNLFKKTFEKLNKKESEGVKDLLIKGFSEEWGIKELTNKISKVTKELTEGEIEKIIRTEDTAIRNKAREFNYIQADPEGQKVFKWIGPSDSRTSSICKNIVNRTSKGVSMERLKEIVRDEGAKKGFIDNRDFVPHISCRHTFISVQKRKYNIRDIKTNKEFEVIKDGA